MHRYYAVLAVIGLSVGLSACSRPAPAPTPVYIEPVYGKYGGTGEGNGGGCAGGQQVAGAAGGTVCVPHDYQRQPDLPDQTGQGDGGGGGQSAPGTAPQG